MTGCVSSRSEDLATIRSKLLGADSATLTLEQWCEARELASPPTVRAEKVDDAAPAISDALRSRLEIDGSEPVGYRHVRLYCGKHLLSDAQNWFVPSRLTEAMRAELASSDTPFGRVIGPLEPVRTNEASTIGPDDPEGTLFKHLGVVRSQDGDVLAIVEERYQTGLLGK